MRVLCMQQAVRSMPISSREVEPTGSRDGSRVFSAALLLLLLSTRAGDCRRPFVTAC